MRKSCLLIASLALLLHAPAAFATVNHGTFNGTDVDFVDVSETTLSAGDAEPLWEAPTLSGGFQLLFFPTNFTSSCAVGGADVTQSELTTTIAAGSGVHIDTLQLNENGDTNLTFFPPFGNANTNVSASLSGTITVTETASGPIAPVVIPISATFAPSDTFELPTNFGVATWTGSIFVDVAAVVPNATKADVSLVNTLTSNCATGNSSAKIQKKVVTGPSVALAVNPVECDLEIDKTCCVTQPVLPDLGSCEGDLVSLDLEYTGDRCDRSSGSQGGAFQCHGRRALTEPADITILKDATTVSASPDTDFLFGDTVSFTSSTGTLPSKLTFKTTDDWSNGQHPNWSLNQYLKIDTSCERAIECDMQFGAYKIVGFESTVGGLVDCSAPPPPPACAVFGDPAGTPCDGKLVDMVLEYNGQPCQMPLPNPQNGEAFCSGDTTGATNVSITYTGMHGDRQTVLPSSLINDGDEIRVTATFTGGLFPNQEFLISDSNGVLQDVGWHVSCSQPLALGDQFGPFTLVEWTTKTGTTLALGDGSDDGTADSCTVPLAPPGPHCTDDLNSVTLVYIGDFLGQGCTVSNGQSGYAFCNGVDDPGDPVSVTPSPSLEAMPATDVEFGDIVTITATGGGTLPNETAFSATGAGGTQWVQFKTNCYKPLSLGDRFGAWVVFAMDRVNDGPITLGGEVQYQYKVTNPNAGTATNVTVTDDQLGVVVSGATLAPSEMQTYVLPATLLGTTTNVATVTGEVGGAVCAPGVDQVTVDVLAPPQSSFSCSDPISELTLIWNGAQTVWVKLWPGEAGVGTTLNEWQNLAPGTAIELTGLGNNYPTLEIFDQSGTVKLGESKFDLWCKDKSMNGLEDCGKNNGNLKWDYAYLNNDWLLEGMVDSDETLSCTPGTVPAPPSCGFGPELLLVLPGLMWVRRRRMQRA